MANGQEGSSTWRRCRSHPTGKRSTTSGTTTRISQQILSVDGIVSARRFAPTDGDGPFIAIYELDCDDLDAAAQQMGELKLTGLDNIAMNPKPIPHVYREIGSLGP